MAHPDTHKAVPVESGWQLPGPRVTLVRMDRPTHPWRDVAARQTGLVSRDQLSAAGVTRWMVRDRIASERWQAVSPRVIATFTGELSSDQRQWLAVLHAGGDALLGGLGAAEAAGLRNWQRDELVVFVSYGRPMPSRLPGVRYIRTRRDLAMLRYPGRGVPRCRLEPAVLLFAAAERSERTAQGVLAAVVQQRLTHPGALLEWVDRLCPLRRAGLFRLVLDEIAGGVESLGELDVARMCRRHRIALPCRQVKRRDARGRLRRTDCEWQLSDGRTLVLEVDGGFHMDVEQWEDDLARQRALSATDRLAVRCTTRELRDDSSRVAEDLLRLGVPRVA